ncbi:MAG TPA: response regulator [Thermoanaerobaculia bacterium]|jgi:CheY-like chemotaxis protein
MKPLALVIENDSGTRKLLDVLLTRFGFEVDLVATGSDALTLLENVHYSVLILDLLIPGRSGTEILQWLGREQPEMLPRIVVLSSLPPVRLDAVRQEWPGVCTIRKPFELSAVVEAAAEASANGVRREPTPAENFCRFSVRAGAKAGVIVTAVDGDVAPVLTFGYEPEVVQSFFPMSLDSAYPLCSSIRTAKPVWLASLTSAGPDYPVLQPVWSKHASRALAVVPLLHAGRAIGAAGWTFREPRLFNEREQQLLTAIADTVVEWLPDVAQTRA